MASRPASQSIIADRYRAQLYWPHNRSLHVDHESTPLSRPSIYTLDCIRLRIDESTYSIDTQRASTVPSRTFTSIARLYHNHNSGRRVAPSLTPEKGDRGHQAIGNVQNALPQIPHLLQHLKASEHGIETTWVAGGSIPLYPYDDSFRSVCRRIVGKFIWTNPRSWIYWIFGNSAVPDLL
jgi:hypothetical protein